MLCLNYTEHINSRASQRGISRKMIEYAIRLGIGQQDKIILTQKLANYWINLIQQELNHRKGNNAIRKNKNQQLDLISMSIESLKELLIFIKKIADKKGIVVVMSGTSLITTYNKSSYRRSENKQKNKHKNSMRNKKFR